MDLLNNSKITRLQATPDTTLKRQKEQGLNNQRRKRKQVLQ